MENPPEKLAFSQQYVRGEAYYGSWGLLAKGIGFANTFLTLSALSLYQYGVFQLVLSLYGAASYFTTIGDGVVNNDITHFIREGKEGKAKKLFYEYNSLRLAASIILFAVFFFGATLFAERYTLGFVAEVRTVSFLFLTEVFFNATESLLAARLKFAVVASRPAITKAAQLLALLYFFFASSIGLEEMFLSMIIGSVVSTLTMVPAFIRLHERWVRTPFAKERILPSIFATYGQWDLYRQFFGQITIRIQPWLIKIFVSTEAVAIFSVATAFIAAIKDVGFPVNTLKTLVPLYLSDPEKRQQIFVTSLRYMLVFSLLVSLGAFLTVPFIINTFLHQYTPALPFFYVMLGGIPLFAIGIITGTFIIALRRQKYLFFQGVTSSLLTLFSYIVFLPHYGLWALAVSQVVVLLAMILVTYFYMLKVQPGVSFKLRQLVAFEKGDLLFASMVYTDVKKMVTAKLRR